MLRNSQLVVALLLLCDALAAPLVPAREVNRKMEGMEVNVRFDGGDARQTPLEAYIAAVLAKESGNFRSDEALKAMAVAVRSYALHFRGRHQKEGFDFCDTTHCQALQPGAVTPRLRKAAAETAGELIWYDRAPAAAYYHADCGGSTEAAQHVWGSGEPYLKQRVDRFCTRNGGGEWNSAFSKQLVRFVLDEQGVEAPEDLDSMEVVQRTPSGRAAKLLLHGEGAVVIVKAGAFRNAMQRGLGWKSVPSGSFTVSQDSDRFFFSGRGAGHAVGLCQAGAERMGKDGKTYRQILAHYYPGTIVGR
jgi:stage II sporulation protein D